MEHTQRSRHHLLVPSQYKRGGPLVRGFKGCGLAVGRKEIYFEVPTKTSFGRNALLGWHFAQKRLAWPGPLDACRRSKCSESVQSLSIEGKAEMEERGKTKQRILFGNKE